MYQYHKFLTIFTQYDGKQRQCLGLLALNADSPLNSAEIVLTQVIFAKIINSCALIIIVLLDRCFWLKF